jgi:hypothetical protein
MIAIIVWIATMAIIVASLDIAYLSGRLDAFAWERALRQWRQDAREAVFTRTDIPEIPLIRRNWRRLAPLGFIVLLIAAMIFPDFTV